MYSKKTKLVLVFVIAIALIYFTTGGFQFTVDPIMLLLSGTVLAAAWWFLFRKGGGES